ncbi:hypothetical protein [Micromonospora inyonensis]|uniref:Uncharacterized protein n=1 Tax=Micromonospora inyonensis TaxID=47866 RepID=A0A1C6R730_9ACTN|nr:hypothetical protein [Micromonospora inyonensis]SCL12826.1 hypothetical protein GA0074694_0016 [Micromonospora inyonensis]SCL21599.1 hypothetical protein GA0074694_3083 [Micromonospora inyonensis]
MSTDTTTKPKTLQQEIADRFARDTTEHQLTVRHDDGLYRHLHCAKPGTGIWSFEVITWPGALVVRGDFGPARVFRRIDDMFEFFRGAGGRINPTYWSEKLDGGSRASAMEHSEEHARQLITECVDQYEADTYPHLLDQYTRRAIPTRPNPPAEVRETVSDYDDEGYLAHADGTRIVLGDLERLGVTADTWEWDLRDWDWTFLWACHAIVWAIQQYDAARGTR